MRKVNRTRRTHSSEPRNWSAAMVVSSIVRDFCLTSTSKRCFKSTRTLACACSQNSRARPGNCLASATIKRYRSCLGLLSISRTKRVPKSCRTSPGEDSELEKEEIGSPAVRAPKYLRMSPSKSSSLLGKRAYSVCLDAPARFAIAAVLAFAKPHSRKRSVAASRTASRRAATSSAGGRPALRFLMEAS